MENNPNDLQRKTDQELLQMVHVLAVEMDRIGVEQDRRTAAASRRRKSVEAILDIEAENAEENEGGLSPDLVDA